MSHRKTQSRRKGHGNQDLALKVHLRPPWSCPKLPIPPFLQPQVHNSHHLCSSGLCSSLPVGFLLWRPCLLHPVGLSRDLLRTMYIVNILLLALASTKNRRINPRLGNHVLLSFLPVSLITHQFAEQGVQTCLQVLMIS